MTSEEELRVRVHGPVDQPCLLYLPGVHGDWTLVNALRSELESHVCFAEVTYPRNPNWGLEAYRESLVQVLDQQGIKRAWLLGESFGSQVAWSLVNPDTPSSPLTVEGLILAGGFVRHPWPTAARLCARLLKSTPFGCLKLANHLYVAWARWRLRSSPIALAGLQEFLRRRTRRDRQAMVKRLALVADNDPRAIAARTTQPVFQLTGLFDPIVPALPVRQWLQHYCPGYHETRTILGADHNVLLAARTSAKHIVRWLRISPS